MRKHSRRYLAALVAAAAIAGQSPRVLGHGMIPQDAPVDRLVTNLEQYIKEHPDDAEGYYRLGRVHLLALERKSSTVPVWGRFGAEDVDKFPRPVEGSWAEPGRGFGKPAKDDKPEDLKKHLSEAVKALNKAIELKPCEARFHLTLGCTLEAGLPYIDDVDVWPLVPAHALDSSDEREKSQIQYMTQQFESAAATGERGPFMTSLIEDRYGERDVFVSLAYAKRNDPKYKDFAAAIRRADWQQQVENQFFVAMTEALPTDGRATDKPIWGGMNDWVAYEAGNDFVRVVEARKARDGDAIRLKVAKATVKAFDELPMPGGITPIVVDLDGRGLASLRAGSSTFDLEGSGLSRRWTWLSPQAGLLVWDPLRTGRITSGWQLFGAVSWRLSFENGYQALDLLDDNRDGRLSGAELEGLAVWFDRNGNGVSDPGEVVPVDQLGVAAISCRATSTDGECPANLAGLRLTDGREVATYDWIAHPAARGHATPLAPVLIMGAAFPTFGAFAARRRRAQPTKESKS